MCHHTASVIKFISSVNLLHIERFRKHFHIHSRLHLCDVQSSDEINDVNHFHPLSLLFCVFCHTIQGDETHKQSTGRPLALGVVMWRPLRTTWLVDTFIWSSGPTPALCECVYMDMSIPVMIGFLKYPVFVFVHANIISCFWETRICKRKKPGYCCMYASYPGFWPLLATCTGTASAKWQKHKQWQQQKRWRNRVLSVITERVKHAR